MKGILLKNFEILLSAKWDRLSNNKIVFGAFSVEMYHYLLYIGMHSKLLEELLRSIHNLLIWELIKKSGTS